MTTEQFRTALSKLGWSQLRAAKELEVRPSSVYRWAHGKRAIPGPVVAALEARIALDVCKKLIVTAERLEK